MKKLYRLKKEVFSYIKETEELEKYKTFEQWNELGFKSESITEVNPDIYFDYGYKENDITSLNEWKDDLTKLYFTLRIRQEYREHDLMMSNHFIELLRKRMNKICRKTYFELDRKYMNKNS